MFKNRNTPILFIFLGGLILLFVVAPLIGMFLATTPLQLFETAKDKEVVDSIWLTLRVSFLSTLFFAIGAIPLSYFLSRVNYKFKNIINGIVDLPVVIPVSNLFMSPRQCSRQLSIIYLHHKNSMQSDSSLPSAYQISCRHG